MHYSEHRLFITGAAISIILITFFVVWAEMNPTSLVIHSKEDGVLENLTAILFGLSSTCFIVFAIRCDFLKNKNKLVYLMTLSWALLMFVFMGLTGYVKGLPKGISAATPKIKKVSAIVLCLVGIFYISNAIFKFI